MYNDIKLRKFRISDAKQMVKIANNEKISQNLRDGFPHPYALKDANLFIDKCLEQEPASIFAIEYQGVYVGNIGLMPGTDVYRKSAEIGYFIGEQYWNKGIATEAIRLITKYGFDKLGVIRIHTGIFEYNTASMRVLEKCGYTKECVRKKSVFKKNKIWDEHAYFIINPRFRDKNE